MAYHIYTTHQVSHTPHTHFTLIPQRMIFNNSLDTESSESFNTVYLCIQGSTGSHSTPITLASWIYY